MPLFFQHIIDDDTKLAIWKIEEEEDFFLEKVPLHRRITHPNKRLQHLAGRYLLQYLFPHFPIDLIQIADTRKPFLEDEAYHFSISHCDEYAAVIVSKKRRVGVDIEVVTEKIGRIQHKFITDYEKSILLFSISELQSQILIWSCKEAIFKWYGLGGVDFKEHINIKKIEVKNNSINSLAVFKKNEDVLLHLHSWFFDDLCLSYVVT